GPHDVAPIEGAPAQALERPDDAFAKDVEPDLLHEQPEEVLVPPRAAPLVLEPLRLEVLVDVGAVGGVGVEALLALGLRALAGRAVDPHPGRAGDLLSARLRAHGVR